MIDNSYIYGAYCDMSKSEVRLSINRIGVIKVYDDGTIELEVPCFVSLHNSTIYFAERDFDREIILSDTKTLFYSRRFIKCRNWLARKREERITVLEEQLNALKKTNKIELIWLNKSETVDVKL